MMDSCQCENKYSFGTGVVLCIECDKTKIGFPLPTVEQLQSYKDYLKLLKDTPTP